MPRVTVVGMIQNTPPADHPFPTTTAEAPDAAGPGRRRALRSQRGLRRTAAVLSLSALAFAGTLTPASAEDAPQDAPAAEQTQQTQQAQQAEETEQAPEAPAGALDEQTAEQMVPDVDHDTPAGQRAWAENAAQNADSAPEDFYQPPAELPGRPGAVVRSEPAVFYADPITQRKVPAEATRIMYTSTDRNGEIAAVTGTVLESTRPWNGEGERPLVTLAPGTQGLGDSCAPSRQMAEGTEYEAAATTALLNAGYNVVVTDYLGSGTPGTHSYLDRLDQGHAVLDAARAASSEEIGAATPTTPTAIYGYSQGGGASASAGELADEYAPELDVKAVYAGAVPADLQGVVNKIDSGPYTAFMVMGIAGLGDANQVDLSRYLNAKGLDATGQIRHECLITATATQAFTATATQAFTDSSTLTLSGDRISDLVAEDPTFSSIMTHNSLGQEGRHPSAPTLIASSVADDVIPHADNRTLAQRYCQAGTRVSFHTGLTPTHVAAQYTMIPRSLIFLDRQFKGLPNANDCWQVGG